MKPKTGYDVVKSYVDELLTNDDSETSCLAVGKKTKSQIKNPTAKQIKHTNTEVLTALPKLTISAKKSISELLEVIPEYEEDILHNDRILFPPILKTKEIQKLDVSDGLSSENFLEEPKPTLGKENNKSKLFFFDSQYVNNTFQTLLFKVGSLSLAIPLVKLSGIYPVNAKLTSLFGKPSWFKGLLIKNDKNYKVIDTADWLISNSFIHNPYEEIACDYILVLENTLWGLGCTKILGTINLEKSQVKWNRNNLKRPWLSGLLINEMCGLLDANILTEIFDGTTDKD